MLPLDVARRNKTVILDVLARAGLHLADVDIVLRARTVRPVIEYPPKVESIDPLEGLL